MTVLWLCALLLQDAPTIDVKAKTWTVRGSATRPDGTELVVALRRIERRWDAKNSRFTEFLSDATRVRGAAVVAKGTFVATTKAAPEGLYQLTVAEGETALFDGRAAVVRFDELFRATKVRVKALQEIAERTKGYLDEIAALLKGDVKPTTKIFEDFIKRVSRDDALTESLSGETDLTATTALLQAALSHARNAQVWSFQRKTSAEEDDLVLGKKGHFLDPDLSLGTLMASVAAVPGVMSAELRLSIAGLLDGHLTAASAKQGAELARAAPVPDKDFIAALESIDLETAQAALKAALKR